MFPHALLFIVLIGLLLSSFLDTQANAQLNPFSISLDQRNAWCRSQISACDELCSSVTKSNDCTVGTLAYNCECTNYLTPILSSYSGTIPTLICLQMFANCKKAAGASKISIDQCQLQFGVHCGTKFPVDFEPPAATTSKTQSTSATSSSTGRSSLTSSKTTTSKDSSTSSTNSSRTATSSISPKAANTLATATRGPTPTITSTSRGTQSTTAPTPTKVPSKGKIDVHILGLALGIPSAVLAIVFLFMWGIARWRHRPDKEKKEVAEADRRSIRSNRGSVLVMNEMYADAIRDHLSKLEMKEVGSTEKSTMLPKDVVGSHRSPAELPSHFSRSHSRVFEME
ncbi:hypothetical protein IFR05_014596 [Cadophora sp. M221]|nr:hypothetical protein IFR05_014596 [Cadophora sp. M221]